MKRREFIAVIGGAAAWPLAARAQQPMPVVGFLSSSSRELNAGPVRAFRQSLGETGYVEGQNVAIEYRFAENQYDSLPALAADLVRRRVDVIAAGGLISAQAAQQATATIPIVFTTGTDPVAFGLVASLNRPGGNLTGVSMLNVELSSKRLELLHELVPAAASVAVILNPTNPFATRVSNELQAAALALGLRLDVINASSEHDFEGAFANLAKQRDAALVITDDGLFINRGDQLGALALRHGVPAIFQFRAFAAAGGLVSYGSSLTDAFRLAGAYTGRILKGEKPADLPVQQSTKVDLIINLKTAKALGLTFPLTLLGRADEVIE